MLLTPEKLRPTTQLKRNFYSWNPIISIEKLVYQKLGREQHFLTITDSITICNCALLRTAHSFLYRDDPRNERPWTSTERIIDDASLFHLPDILIALVIITFAPCLTFKTPTKKFQVVGRGRGIRSLCFSRFFLSIILQNLAISFFFLKHYSTLTF